MVMTKFFIGAAALSAPLVAGHGLLGLPTVYFPKGGDVTAPANTIASSQFKAPAGMSFTTDPESNTKAYTAWIKTSEYSSLRDLILKKGNVGECGNSALADPQPLPDMVEWTHGASEGFTASHQGPCEVWCDDKMAFHDDNCAKNYPAAPAKLPYDKSKCAGAKKLAIYWLALHSPDWQIYIGCAALSGASAGGSSSNGGGASPTPTKATPTVKPSTPSSPASTPAPAPAPAAGGNTGNDEDCDEEYPEPADEDCDDNLPEPADEDCDEEYPEPGDAVAGDADVGKDADCDEEYPEPADDCDEEYPEPADEDCDDDLPEPDCDDDLPEPRSYEDEEEDVQTSNINFNTYNDNVGEDAPGKVTTQEY